MSAEEAICAATDGRIKRTLCALAILYTKKYIKPKETKTYDSHSVDFVFFMNRAYCT